ncbi:MAG TPA: 3-phosphoserine/phosphohydroxythreonine transaminase [Eubacteriales bacterium]|nr:3-phosphoserine/phosphohydroxythreonine transaminase [Eubacteriales bacterium]
MRVFNFCAGPSTMPVEVLKKFQDEMLDYHGSGMGPMEFSHRAPIYDEINEGAMALLRELMGIPENYEILFLTGGATTQFEGVPLNLLGKNNKADYIVTGHWANNSYKAATKYGDCVVAGTSEDKKYTYTPDFNIRKDAAYVHITTNNTIYGTRFSKKIDTNVPIVADMSSNILSQPYNVSDYGVIYAGSQKNMACAGLTVVIVRKDLLNEESIVSCCPNMIRWTTHAAKKSIFNTPPTYIVYVLKTMLEWLKKFGGVEKIYEQNLYQAKLVYDAIDNSKIFSNPVKSFEDRSLMNLIFTTGNEELDAKFIKEATANGMLYLKGHRAAGGMRASLYNAMSNEGAQYLAEFIKKFDMENK